jgi:hypothetical protein
MPALSHVHHRFHAAAAPAPLEPLEDRGVPGDQQPAALPRSAGAVLVHAHLAGGPASRPVSEPSISQRRCLPPRMGGAV